MKMAIFSKMSDKLADNGQHLSVLLLAQNDRIDVGYTADSGLTGGFLAIFGVKGPSTTNFSSTWGVI